AAGQGRRALLRLQLLEPLRPLLGRASFRMPVLRLRGPRTRCAVVSAQDDTGGDDTGGDDTGGDHSKRQQGVVEFVRVANDGPRFLGNFGDDRGVEYSGAVEIVANRSAQLHRAGAALFKRRVVQIRVRIGVENFVAERRGFGRIDRNSADRSAFDLTENRLEAVDVHRFVQTVRDGFAHEHVVGNANGSGQVFRAGG